MKKINTFAYSFSKSLTSMEYYKDVAKAKLGFSIKYLFMLAICASLVVTAAITVRIGPEIYKFGNDLIPEINKAYPQDLEITAKDNAWSINKPEPYNIPTPEIAYEFFGRKDQGLKMPSNVIVFDKNGTIDDLDKKDTLFLLNEKNMLARGENKLEVYPIKDVPNGTFTYKEFLQITKGIGDFLRLLPIVIVPCIFGALLLINFSYRLVYLLVVALALLVINLFTKINLKFGELYRISLHAMTLPLIIDVILNVCDLEIPMVPWFFIVNVLFGLVALTTFARVKKAKK
jgi:hypothetical protein